MLFVRRFLGRCLPAETSTSTSSLPRRLAHVQRVSSYVTLASRSIPSKTSSVFGTQSSGYGRYISPPSKIRGRVALVIAQGVRSASTSSDTSKPKKKNSKARKAKKRVRKALTPEQKEKKKERLQKQKVRELKEQALLTPKNSPPPLGVVTPWTLVVKESAGPGGLKPEAAKSRYYSLSPSEMEHYNQQARQETAEKRLRYKQWVESHPPSRIASANLARASLRRLAKKDGTTRSPINSIRDDRQPKAPASAFTHFVTDRFSSGDLQNIKASEALKLIANEWHGLSPEQKKAFDDAAAADRERYNREKASL